MQVPLIEPKDEPTVIVFDGAHHHYHHTQQIHPHQDPYAVELSQCNYGDSEFVLSLVLKSSNWHDLSDTRKAKVLAKLSQFFAIPKEFITMESVTKHGLYEMQKYSVKRGTNKCHHNNRKLGRVNFIIGCGTKYFSIGEPIAKQIGQQMKDGSLDNITGEKFGWWIIWRKQYKDNKSNRNRRQVEGSGDEDDDYEEDYEYDEDEDTVQESATDIPTTTTHAHRHHHGDNGAQTQPEPVGSGLDEEIVESVSQLESVITKTIENTKNLNEATVDAEDAVVDDDLDNDTDDLDVLQPIPDLVTSNRNDISNLNSIYNQFNSKTNEKTVEGSVSEIIDNLASASASATQMQTPNLLNTIKNESILISTLSPSITFSTSIRHNNENLQQQQQNLQYQQQTFGDSKDFNQHNVNSTSYSSPISSYFPSSDNVNVFSSTTSSLPSTISIDTTLTSPSQLSSLSSQSSLSSSSSLPSSSPSSSSSSSSSSLLLSPSKTISSTTPVTTTSTVITTTITTQNKNLPSALQRAKASTSLSATNENIEQSITTVEPMSIKENPENSLSSTVQIDIESSSYPTISYTSSSSIASTAASSTSAEITTTTTTTTAVPDYVEPKIENSPPIIRSRLQKLAVTSGKSFKFSIPEDTFYDNEDMNNLRLEITDKDGHELKTNSWLQFNSEIREIYGLPLDDAVSKWQYRLTATDSGNESVTEIVEISVQQHRGVRTVNHEINIAVKINEKNIHYIDWQLKLIEAVAITMGDNNTKSIVVREIRQTPQDAHTATLVYFNETLPTSECPELELNSLVKHLDAQRLSDLVYPMLGIKSITGQLTGTCQKIIANKPKTPSISVKNSPPVPRNQVDRVVATTGHLLVYRVPSDTFFDPNDNELKLNLKTKDNKDINPRHWLQFDTKNHEFYGIPRNIGTEEYLLVAEDAGGLTATDALVVQVNHAPKREFSVYFKIYLAIRHELFNADLQRKFVERIAQLFGDGSTQNIQIRSVTTHHDADGTIVNFYNTTLFKMHNRCPEEEIEMARNVYLDGHSVRDKFKKLMGPELNVTNVQVTTLGICNPQTDVTHREFIPNRTEEPLLRSTFSDDYMFTIIMPAIIIVVMILIAAIIACCLHRRRRKSGKMELGDEEERKSFRTKGIPVIFQDELDEKPEIGNKSPIILKDEKPPLLPPSYNTSNMNGDNDVDEYVPPPAVVMGGGREARGKSPATPSYRKPPPYVSP
uniref:Dystroglycan 1 n=1 Tax=Glossina brevipalpis TaxID=37001 RepID=A0A1A9WGL4_9MUSC